MEQFSRLWLHAWARHREANLLMLAGSCRVTAKSTCSSEINPLQILFRFSGVETWGIPGAACLLPASHMQLRLTLHLQVGALLQQT